MTHDQNLDEKIRMALQAELPADLLSKFDEQSLFSQSMQIFRGRNRWINTIMVFCTLACLGLCVYSAYRFYWAQEFKELLLWSVAIIVCFLAISVMKIWAWLEMEKYSMVREIKRLELQVVSLSTKLRQTV